MFDEDRPGALGDELPLWETSGDGMVPAGHSSDPFACPCCANVFAELIEHAGLDLGAQGAALPRQPARAGSLWLTNARLRTMNPTQPVADSLWVRDGKIVWVGDAEDAPADAQDSERIDAGGRTVLPGFIEPHMHLPPLAMLRAFENVGPFRFERTADALAHLKQVADQTPAGDWIVGRQFDPSLQEGPDALTSDMLDEVSRVHPVFVYNASLHLAYCNRAALEVAGVTAQTQAPPGSELGRYANGEPNGVLKAGPAMGLVARYNPLVRSQDVASACFEVFEHAASLGLTMLCDMGTGLFQGAKELELYDGLRASGRMAARFRYALGYAAQDKWDAMGLRWGEGDAWVRNMGWKIVSDGSNQGRTGLQREPFLGSDERGIAYVEADELTEAVCRRLGEGWAVCVHANGDAAIDRVLDAFTEAKRRGLDPAAKRCRIEHCSILHDEQIERIAELGLSPSFLIGHVHFWGAAFVDDVFGLEKAELLDRTASCEAKGIRWTLHSDDPVTELGPLRCIENAVTRNLWRGDGKLAADECISVAAALRAATIDAAWQCHSEHEVGSLEPGKYADFVMLDADPEEVAPDRIGAIGVLGTWVNGRQVYSA